MVFYSIMPQKSKDTYDFIGLLHFYINTEILIHFPPSFLYGLKIVSLGI